VLKGQYEDLQGGGLGVNLGEISLRSNQRSVSGGRHTNVQWTLGSALNDHQTQDGQLLQRKGGTLPITKSLENSK